MKTVRFLSAVLAIGAMHDLVYADQAASYNDALTFGAGQMATNPASNNANSANVPGYNTNPPQASYYGNAGAMSTDAGTETTSNPAGQFFTSSQQRPLFTIDKTTDPMIQNSASIGSPSSLTNFLNQFGGCSTETQIVPGAKTQTTCQQYRPDQFYTCDQTLSVTTASVTRLEYYPSQCLSWSVFCDSRNYSWFCGAGGVFPTAQARGWNWFFVQGANWGQIPFNTCNAWCDGTQVNSWTFGRGTALNFCSMNNCGAVTLTYTSEGIPTYTCSGGVPSNLSQVTGDCPTGYNKTVQADGKVICRESKVSTYQNDPTCSKINDIPQTSLTPGVSVYWEVWACNSWADTCTTFEARAP
jgi:hypothetical protein